MDEHDRRGDRSTTTEVALGPIDLSDDAVASRVIEIQRAAYRVEADLIGFDGIPPLHDDVADVRALDLAWLGSWDAGELVGFVAWSVSGATCDIDRLAVHPEHARRGHGRALVTTLLHHAVVTVSTGTANTPARRLYESLGFVAVGSYEIAPDVTLTDLRRTH